MRLRNIFVNGGTMSNTIDFNYIFLGIYPVKYSIRTKTGSTKPLKVLGYILKSMMNNIFSIFREILYFTQNPCFYRFWKFFKVRDSRRQDYNFIFHFLQRDCKVSPFPFRSSSFLIRLNSFINSGFCEINQSSISSRVSALSKTVFGIEMNSTSLSIFAPFFRIIPELKINGKRKESVWK